MQKHNVFKRTSFKPNRPAKHGSGTYMRNKPTRLVKATGEVKCLDVIFVQPAGGFVPQIAAPASFSENTLAFTGITELNNIGLGDQYYNRIGSKVMVKSVQMNVTFKSVGANVANVRTMLVWDSQCNGIAPTLLAILQTANAVPVTPMFGGVWIPERERFTILRDQTFSMSASTQPIVNWNPYVKIRMPTSYSGTAVNLGLADIKSGALYFLAFADGAAGSISIDNQTSRLRYTD